MSHPTGSANDHPISSPVGRMTGDFRGQRALVTGASRGIGLAIARQFAAAGAQVAVHYNSNRAAAEGALASLAPPPQGSHILVQADLGDPDAVPGLIERVLAPPDASSGGLGGLGRMGGLGGLDIVVNNAGIYERHRILDETLDYAAWQRAWQRTININLTGPANVMYHAARHMAVQGGGRIINISSRGAFRGEPEMPAYGASKAGLNAMSQSLAQALAPKGVYVYVVAPGWVETDMAHESLNGPGGAAIKAQSPMGRVARPEEIAHAVLFLASQGNDYMTGAILDVNGASYLRS